MKYIGTIDGIRNDFGNNDLFNKTKFQINYMDDHKGKTLSIGDLETNVQFSIPFDELFKIINKGGSK